jgi:hypothetical protein
MMRMVFCIPATGPRGGYYDVRQEGQRKIADGTELCGLVAQKIFERTAGFRAKSNGDGAPGKMIPLKRCDLDAKKRMGAI